jgi:Immunity protein Imm5
MLTTSNFQEIFEQAYQAVVNHPVHALAHIYRRSIYQELQSGNIENGPLARKWLAVITARYVLLIWQNRRPHDDLATRALALAEQVCNQEVQGEVAQDEAGNY